MAMFVCEMQASWDMGSSSHHVIRDWQHIQISQSIAHLLWGWRLVTKVLHGKAALWFSSKLARTVHVTFAMRIRVPSLDVLVGQGLAWLQDHQTCPLGVLQVGHLHHSCLACPLLYILVCQLLCRASLCAAILARPETATCAAPSHLLTPQIAPLWQQLHALAPCNYMFTHSECEGKVCSLKKQCTSIQGSLGA